ncbi:unnamed protein product, partial [Discosporangium mesarthrocarpum]
MGGQNGVKGGSHSFRVGPKAERPGGGTLNMPRATATAATTATRRFQQGTCPSCRREFVSLKTHWARSSTCMLPPRALPKAPCSATSQLVAKKRRASATGVGGGSGASIVTSSCSGDNVGGVGDGERNAHEPDKINETDVADATDGGEGAPPPPPPGTTWEESVGAWARLR